MWEVFGGCADEGDIKWLHNIRELKEKSVQSQDRDARLVRKLGFSFSR